MRIGRRRFIGVIVGIAALSSGFVLSELWANLADTSAAAEKAKQKYLAAVELAQTQYSSDVQTFFDAYLKELDAIQIAETKAGRLEVAIAVRDEIKRLQEEGAPVFAEASPTSLRLAASRLAGTWYVVAVSGAKRTYVIDGSGKVRFVDEKKEGQLKGRPKEMTVDFGDGKIERWTYADGRLFVEYFDPKNSYPGKPASTIGTGTRLKP